MTTILYFTELYMCLTPHPNECSKELYKGLSRNFVYRNFIKPLGEIL